MRKALRRVRPRVSGEGVDYVTCRICRRRFRTISASHLVRIHHSRAGDPLDEYKRKYGVERVKSLRTIRAQRRSLLARYVQLGNRWTRARVVSEIRKLRRRGASLNANQVALRHTSLQQAARRLFGNWDRALRACAIDPKRVRKCRRWTPALVVRAIRVIRRSALSHAKASERDPGLVYAACLRFGSWDEALRAAGFNPVIIRKRRHWDPDLVLEEIRRVAPGRSQEEILRSDPDLLAIAVFYFQNWPTALEAARLVPRENWRPPPWPREKILAEMRRRVRTGGSLAWRALYRDQPGIVTAALERFGSWRAAVQAAGFRVSPSMTRQEWTRPELLRLVGELIQAHGTVNQRLLRKATPEGYLSAVLGVRRLLGSLSAVRKIVPGGRLYVWP